MAEKVIGVDLGTHAVKVVVLSSKMRSVQVVDAFSLPVLAAAGEGGRPLGDADQMRAALQVAVAALRQRGLAGETLGVSLPATETSYRVLSFPFADDRRIAQAVAFAADGEFPLPLDQLNYGHVVVPGAGNGGRALVAAARRDIVDMVASVFDRAELKSVTSGATAIAQIADPSVPPAGLELAERGLQPVVLAIDVGHTATQMIALGTKGPLAVRVVRRGGKQITAAIARGYGLDASSAEAAKQRDAFLPHRGYSQISAEQLQAGKLVAEAIETLIREIEHTRLWLRATYHLEVVKLVLCGGGSALAGLEPYFGEHTGLPVEALHARPAAAIRGLESRKWAPYASALGAAFGAARRPLVQLHDAIAGRSDGSWLQERLVTLAGIGVAVLAFGALDTLARARALEKERQAYASELEDLTRTVFGQAIEAEEVDAKLAEVESEDLTSLVPHRGALELLASITEAATPSDLGTAPQPPPASAAGPLLEGEGEDGEVEGDRPPAAPVDEPAAKPAAPAGPIDPTKGVITSDELVISMIDIRERKIELKAEAASSSAQDRLAFKLKQVGCISNISKGKVKGEERKSFEMSMDHNCFMQTAAEEKPAEPEAEAEAPAEPAGVEEEGAG